jgi:hypothetical protein
MTPEQERIDAASHAPACPAVVDGFPCNRNLGHWGDHAAGLDWLLETARDAERKYAEYVSRHYAR